MPLPRQATPAARRLAARLALALAAALGAPRLAAQGVPAAPDECWRFAFGAWSPPLDARAAGHGRDFPSARPSGMISGRAPEGGGGARDWASRVGMSGDSTLMLYPAWWGAGVELVFPSAAMAHDTIRGRATALVADARVANPVAPVVAWRVSCTGRDLAPPPPVLATPPDSARAARTTAPARRRRPPW